MEGSEMGIRIQQITIGYNDKGYQSVMFNDDGSSDPLEKLFNWLIEQGLYSDINVEKHYGVPQSVINRMRG